MKLRHLLIGMLAFVAAVSCKEDQPVEAPTLEVSKTSLSFAAEGGEASFTITTNKDWTATPDADWVNVETTSGKASAQAITIKVTAEENTASEARTATIKVKAGDLNETVSITQAKKEATEPEQPEQPEQPEPEPVVPAIEAGPYWIMGTKDNVTKVMSPLAAEKNYGYAPSEEAVDGKSYAKNVFTFAAVEGGFTIADASGRYYYQEKGTTYKTFNAGTDGTLAGCVWTVTKNDDGTYAIVNAESGKTIRYAEGTYTSFGVYTDAEANGSVLVNLVKADNPLEDPKPEPEVPTLSGTGTEADPYVLSTAEHMVQMRTLAKLDATTYFKLGADIDMSSVKNWTPVNYDQNFTRQTHIDGNNKTITNFAPEAFVGDDQTTAASYPSLFGVLYGSCKNLTIKDSKIIATATTPSCGFLGGYVGTSGKPALVENVHIEGEISGGSCLGGFGGQSREGTFMNCTSKVKITSGGTDVGGFIGKTAVSTHLENCTAEVELVPTEAVSGNLRYAGIVGYTTGNSMKVINCSAKGTITSGDKSVRTAGGIVAYAGAGECEVSNCFSDVSVLGGNVSNTGGICGVASCATSLLIQNCYSTGEFTVYQVNAGILSKHEKGVAQIKNCYSTIKIDGYSGLGGLIGQGVAGLEITMTNCFAWNPSLTATREAVDKYSSGAIAASVSGKNTFTGNFRNPAMVLTDPFRTIQNHEDLAAATPEGDANQHAFDGKPAAESATVSSLAKAAGWDETIWDLSGDLPVFKK